MVDSIYTHLARLTIDNFDSVDRIHRVDKFDRGEIVKS